MCQQQEKCTDIRGNDHLVKIGVNAKQSERIVPMQTPFTAGQASGISRNRIELVSKSDCDKIGKFVKSLRRLSLIHICDAFEKCDVERRRP